MWKKEVRNQKKHKRKSVFGDWMRSSYCEAFAVLSSQRVQAAVIGVGEKRWSEIRVWTDMILFL